MSISQSIECPLTTRDTVTLSGNMSTQNGNGSGNFQVSGRRLVNKGWFELDAGIGNNPVLGLKGSRNLTQKIFCNAGLSVAFRQNVIIPILTSSECFIFRLLRLNLQKSSNVFQPSPVN